MTSRGAAADASPGVSTPGNAGRRFSRWYKTDFARWLDGDYKTLSADEEQSGIKRKVAKSQRRKVFLNVLDLGTVRNNDPFQPTGIGERPLS